MHQRCFNPIGFLILIIVAIITTGLTAQCLDPAIGIDSSIPGMVWHNTFVAFCGSILGSLAELSFPKKDAE
jgi:hypothetical protein